MEEIGDLDEEEEMNPYMGDDTQKLVIQDVHEEAGEGDPLTTDNFDVPEELPSDSQTLWLLNQQHPAGN